MSASPLADITNGRSSLWQGASGGALVTPTCNYTNVTSAITVRTGPGVLYGIVCTVGGTMTAVHDNTSAAGTILIPSQTLTAGQTVTFGGVGVRVVNGIFANWASGTFLVLWA